MRKLLILLFFIGCPAFGQVQQIQFPAPLFWDANTDGVTVEYGAYSSSTSCTHPNPSPAKFVALNRVATVSHTPLTICTPDCITWTDPGPVVFGQSTFYRVTALNSSGDESAFSEELELIWLEPTPDVPGRPRTNTVITFLIRENGPQVDEVVGQFVSGLRTSP